MAGKLTALAALVLASVALLSVGSAQGAGLIAPASVCPGQNSLGAPPAAQEETMLCMTNYAREQYGEGNLEPESELQSSAASKARDVIRCDEFSHNACGREFTYWMRSTGYLSSKCWRVGENLAWGVGAFGSRGSIFRAWMRSTTHRENLLTGSFEEVGIDLVVGRLDGVRGTRIWAQHFGTHCEPQS